MRTGATDTPAEEGLPAARVGRPKRTARDIARLIGRLSFVVLAPIAILSALRIIRLEGSSTVASFETFLPLLLLPAYLGIAVAALARVRALAALSLVLIACHLTWTLPEYLQQRPLPPGATTAPSFTLYSHNVLFDNPTPEVEAARIRAVDADVVMLEELSQRVLHSLDDHGAFSAYPYRFTNGGWSTDGMGIFSKTPLVDESELEDIKFHPQRAVTTVHGRQIVLWNVHLLAPVGGTAAWEAGHRALGARLRAETGDVVVAGDFNATFQHRPFRGLLDQGLHDVAIDRGRAWQRTWPANGDLSSKVGGFIRIDHVLTKGSVTGTSIRTGDGDGSDHHSLLTRLALD